MADSVPESNNYPFLSVIINTWCAYIHIHVCVCVCVCVCRERKYIYTHIYVVFYHENVYKNILNSSIQNGIIYEVGVNIQTAHAGSEK